LIFVYEAVEIGNVFHKYIDVHVTYRNLFLFISLVLFFPNRRKTGNDC